MVTETHVDSLLSGSQDISSFGNKYVCAGCGSALDSVQVLQQHFRESHIEDDVAFDPRTIIGYLLQLCPCQCQHASSTGSPSQQASPTEISSQPTLLTERLNLQASPETQSDDYPELLALDDYEWPRDGASFRNCYVFGNFKDQEQGLRTFECIINMLNLDGFVSPDEMMSLWPAFLDYEQRIGALKLFENIDWSQDAKTVVQNLRACGLGALIAAWADFISLLDTFPHGLSDTPSVTEIMWAVLTLCCQLESVIDKFSDDACRRGYSVPDLVSPVPKLSRYSVGAPVVYFLKALYDRVESRKSSPYWVRFTKIMVLQEIKHYLKDLKTVVRAVFPSQEYLEDLQHFYGQFP